MSTNDDTGRAGEAGPRAGTDTTDAAEETNADETLADIAVDADDDPGKGGD